MANSRTRSSAAGAEIDEQTSGDVLTTIEGWKLDEVRHAAAKMLSNDGPRPNATPWHHYPRARDAARSLWPTEPVTGAIAESEDLYLEAINHPAGNLAQFWSAVVQWEWTQAGDKWHGIAGELKSELDRMIDSEDRNGLLATVILASQLSFYFAADQDWASGRLLPLFTWENCELRARGVWHGFLTAGHPNDGLLADGLLDAYLATCHHSEALPMALLDRLSIQLASMSLHAGADPLEWVPRFVVAASEELRVSWAEQVGRILEACGPDEAGMQWERWICAYWSARVRSTPLPLATSEATVAHSSSR